MKFKNAVVYCFSEALELTNTELNEALRQNAFKPIESEQLSSKGFVPPFPHKEENREELELYYFINGRGYFALRTDEKRIKASHLNQKINEKVAAIEKAEARKVYKKERSALKDEIVLEMLPDTMADPTVIHGYINPKLGIVVIAAASHTAAEGVLSYLRGALGSLPIRVAGTQKDTCAIMTNWLQQEPKREGDFDPLLLALSPDCIEDEALFKSNLMEGSSIKIKGDSPFGDEALSYIEAGYRCDQLRLSSSDEEYAGVSYTLHSDLAIKSIKYPASFNEAVAVAVDNRNVDYETEDDNLENLHWDADAILACDCFERSWLRLVMSFGGYDKPPATW